MSWKTGFIIALVVIGTIGSVVSAFAWEVRLGWGDPNNDPVLVTGYNLRYRRQAFEASYIAPPIDVGDNLTFIVTNLQDGFQYCFVVTAYAPNVPESGYSNELCVGLDLNVKPVASIEQPVAGSTVSGTQLVQVRVIDLNDIDGSHIVTLDINNIGNWIQMLYNAANQLYETIWDTATIESLFPQLVDLIAIAVDSVGSASDPALVTVTVTAPPANVLPLTTVAFDDPVPPGNPSDFLDGIFQGIDFGIEQWRWEGAYGVNSTNHIFFSSNVQSGSFTFSPGPKMFVSMQVFTGQDGTLTLTDNNGQTKTQVITTGSLQTVITGWTKPSLSVTLTFTGGWDLGIDDIVYSDIYTIFPSISIPSMIETTDSNAVELGVRFISDVDASIIGIRFYKGVTNIGLHTGNIWTEDGELLGTITFANETPDGWQEAFFATPIPITANTIYVASYHTPSGNYAFDENYFVSPLDNPPLHASVDNGVYQYGDGGVFPSSTWNASNYWVDVVMVP